ncbi:Putative ribonuclease H protein At1g65750, partial [Linum grandiflorum]
GGLIRDTAGSCKAAFAANFGVCSITRAELHAALHGLHLACDRRYIKVNLQVALAVVVSFIQKTGPRDLQHQACVEKITQLLARNWLISVTHTYREGNRVADLLAHHRHSLSFGMHLITYFSSEVIHYIQGDIIGVSFPGFTLINN